MKQHLIFLLSGVCVMQPGITSTHSSIDNKPLATTMTVINNESPVIISQAKDGPGKLSAVKFKNQEYCRAELENFDFDARFSIISATVYFSGANFNTVEKGFITSSSLKPIKHLMNRCIPGTLVVFDDIKVLGPDKEVRTIESVSYLLH